MDEEEEEDENDEDDEENDDEDEEEENVQDEINMHTQSSEIQNLRLTLNCLYITRTLKSYRAQCYNDDNGFAEIEIFIRLLGSSLSTTYAPCTYHCSIEPAVRY